MKEVKNVENLSTEKLAEIKERIEQSTKKYERIKTITDKKAEARKAFKAKCHEGNEFLKQYKNAIIKNSLFNFMTFGVSVVCVPNENGPPNDKSEYKLYNCAYSIKIPSDSHRKHIASGICGYHIKHNTDRCFEVMIPNFLTEVKHHPFVVMAIGEMVCSKLMLLPPEIPQRLRTHMLKTLNIKP